MRDLPDVPSEVLEPHLVVLLSVAIQQLGAFEECPDVKWFKDWRLRFQGVSYLLIGMAKGTPQSPGPVHASMVWDQQIYPWIVAADMDEEPERAQAERERLWHCAKLAVEGVRGC